MIFILGEADIKELMNKISKINKEDIHISAWDSESQTVLISFNIKAIEYIVRNTLGSKINITGTKILSAKDPSVICAVEVDMDSPLLFPNKEESQETTTQQKDEKKKIEEEIKGNESENIKNTHNEEHATEEGPTSQEIKTGEEDPEIKLEKMIKKLKSKRKAVKIGKTEFEEGTI
ncbi:MAG: hypothetical protein ABIM30_00035 [candidate division WOR-3 bacterium]